MQSVDFAVLLRGEKHGFQNHSQISFDESETWHHDHLRSTQIRAYGVGLEICFFVPLSF